MGNHINPKIFLMSTVEKADPTPMTTTHAITENTVEKVKRGRGRPRKNPEDKTPKIKGPRGRPKIKKTEEVSGPKIKKARGRPKKYPDILGPDGVALTGKALQKA